MSWQSAVRFWFDQIIVISPAEASWTKIVLWFAAAIIFGALAGAILGEMIEREWFGMG